MRHDWIFPPKALQVRPRICAGVQGPTEIIEKWAEFSLSRVSHFQFWAKCNRPFVHISPGVDHECGWNLCYYLNEAKQSTKGGRQGRGVPNTSRGSGRRLVLFWSLATISVHINVASDGTRNLWFDDPLDQISTFWGTEGFSAVQMTHFLDTVVAISTCRKTL